LADTKPIEGLVFDKIVFDCLKSESERGHRESMSIDDAKKATGLAEEYIIRAIAQIRAKGYPVVSQKMEPLAENRFRLPSDQKEYAEWRDDLVSSIHGLIHLLHVCDKGADARFGPVAKQESFRI